MKNKPDYFLASFLSAGIKTVWYAFTMPSSIRKAIEKDEEYKSHVKGLMKIAEAKGEGESAEKYIHYGDLAGFAGGLTAIGLYANEVSKNPDLFEFWIVTNLLSFGYEIGRGIEKAVRHLRK